MGCDIRIWDKIGWKFHAFTVFLFYISICTQSVISMTLPETTVIPSSGSTTEPSVPKPKDYGSGNDVNNVFKWIIVVFSVILILLTVSCALFRWMSNQEALFRSYGSEYSFYPPRRWKSMTPPPSYSELFPIHFPSSVATDGNVPGSTSVNSSERPTTSIPSVTISNPEPSTSTVPVEIPTTSSVPVIRNLVMTTWDQKRQQCFTTVYPVEAKEVSPSSSNQTAENNYLPSYEEALRMLSCQSA